MTDVYHLHMSLRSPLPQSGSVGRMDSEASMLARDQCRTYSEINKTQTA